MFSDKIRELRKANGWTQIDLAAKLGVSKATVGMWETGNREAGVDKLKAIAELFNVTIDELLGKEAKATDAGTEADKDVPSKNRESKDQGTTELQQENRWRSFDDIPEPKLTEKERNQLAQWMIEDEFLELIKKYWRLDEFGRRNVDTIIQNEYHRCVFQKRLQPTYGTDFRMVKDDVQSNE